MSLNFFESLRPRLERIQQPGVEFDRAFWAKFEGEFMTAPKTAGRYTWTELLRPAFLIPSLATLALVVAGVLLTRSSTPLPGLALTEGVLERGELYAELEMYEALDGDIELLDADGPEGDVDAS